MKELLSYLKSKIFLRNLAYTAGIVFTSIVLLLVLLRFYTHHNRAVAIPDFSDLPVETATKLISSRHLRYEIFDSVFVAALEPGTIIDQHPKPGSLVKKNRKIYLTINATTPEKMIMPDLVGLTLREARTKILVAGLLMGKLNYRFSIAKNVVLEQHLNGSIIEPGDTLLKGSLVDLILGKGLSDEKSMVPYLIGMNMEQALTKASDAFFSINTFIPDETVAKNPDKEPVIYRQHPAHSAKIMVPLGTQITVWVTADSTRISETGKHDMDNMAWPETHEIDDVKIIEDDTYDLYDTD